MFAYSSFSGFSLLLFLIAGLALLCFGGDWLAKGASGLALKCHISPIVIGLTLVSVATSMPEFVTGFVAASQGSAGLAVGSIVGSNVGNITLILGIAACISPIAIQARLITQEVPILLIVTILFTGFSLHGFLGGRGISRMEGGILLGLACAYVLFLISQVRKGRAEEVKGLEDEAKGTPGSLLLCILLLFVGALALGIGADWLVGGATEMAVRFQVREGLVGFTLVAIGTSLPELATSIAAALRKESDLIIGNIVGSNIFNTLLIAGGVSSFYPMPVDRVLMAIELPSLLLVTLLLWLVCYTDYRISRKEGLFLILLYGLIIGVSIAI